jgi:hypothetical protein
MGPNGGSTAMDSDQQHSATGEGEGEVYLSYVNLVFSHLLYIDLKKLAKDSFSAALKIL